MGMSPKVSSNWSIFAPITLLCTISHTPDSISYRYRSFRYCRCTSASAFAFSSLFTAVRIFASTRNSRIPPNMRICPLTATASAPDLALGMSLEVVGCFAHTICLLFCTKSLIPLIAAFIIPPSFDFICFSSAPVVDFCTDPIVASLRGDPSWGSGVNETLLAALFCRDGVEDSASFSFNAAFSPPDPPPPPPAPVPGRLPLVEGRESGLSLLPSEVPVRSTGVGGSSPSSPGGTSFLSGAASAGWRRERRLENFLFLCAITTHYTLPTTHYPLPAANRCRVQACRSRVAQVCSTQAKGEMRTTF
mmetsp:Transcript_4195/g.8273  ORF Transcript_4195/g.8273 Transcript_4195/m.8273 type:complete len:305 (-) Transcript_4195:295-1209(-)